MTELFLPEIIRRMALAGNPELAARARKYMRNHFDSLGVDAKTLRTILKECIQEYGLPDMDTIMSVALHLWKLPERDYQHVALEILRKVQRRLRKQDLQKIEEFIISKSWWDTVDGLAGWICGSYFQLFPEQIKPVTGRWMDSGNMWLQRTCLIFQLGYKKNTDTELLSSFIVRLAEHPDFFIRKAIGWALRQYSKTDAQWVKEFIQTHEISPLSYREASKYV